MFLFVYSEGSIKGSNFKKIGIFCQIFHGLGFTRLNKTKGLVVSEPGGQWVGSGQEGQS